MGVGDLVVNSNTVRDLDITSITYALPLRYSSVGCSKMSGRTL